MYLKMLVPLDGSQMAECVLPHVEALSGSHEDASITFLYVVPPLDVPLTSASYKEKIESEAKAAAEDYLKKLCAKPKFKGKASGKVMIGRIADTIVDYAAKRRMDLIVMATHGRSGVSHWFYGSVAEKVVHGTKIPIWLVKASSCQKISYTHNKKLNVLVPLDGSQVAEVVLSHLKELNKQLPKNKLGVILTRVCEIFSPPLSYPPPLSMSWDEYLKWETKRCKAICRDYLTEVQDSLNKFGLKTHIEVPEGNPAEVLIDYINKNSIDLVIMSTHGRTGISKWAFGSIAEKLLKGAESAILLIRAK